MFKSYKKNKIILLMISFILISSNSYSKSYAAPKLGKQEFYVSANDYDMKDKKDKASYLSNNMLLTVKKGDTITKIFKNTGFSQKEALAVDKAIKKTFPKEILKLGQKIRLFFNIEDNFKLRLKSLVIDSLGLENIEVVKVAEDEFIATKVKKDLNSSLKKVSFDINKSLFESSGKSGVNPSTIFNLVKLLSYRIDFQRDIREGNHVELLYRSYYDKNGNELNLGKLIYASLQGKKGLMKIYRYSDLGGKIMYYNEKGETIYTSLLKTPIDGARVTSNYGFRKHPVLGYSKLHKGIDFGAPKGTPIYASGDGVIVKAAPFGSYGNYVRINHNNNYNTAYAHMNGFAKNIKKGKKVKQGDVIGYVGNTGRVTGPHLHYEVLYKGKHINPVQVSKNISGKKLSSDEMKIFKQYRKAIDHYIVSEDPKIAFGSNNIKFSTLIN